MKIALKLALAIAVAALMSQPAAAEWFAHGNYEPDTPYDTAQWMWQDAPGSATNRLYFSVISGYNAAVISFGKPTINPNVGVIHTRTETPTLEIQHGFLGVWVDCNKDGYMGHFESALREYSSALLTDKSLCPETPGPTTSWTAGAHNYNGWVSEYVPIIDASTNFDARAYVDPDAHIWGDFDRPDEHPLERNCPTTSFPRGALQTTGGVLSYLDCRMDILGPSNFVMESIGDPLDLTFSDEDNASTGRLGQVWLWGDPSTDRAAVSAVDCDETPTSVGPVDIRTPAPTLLPASNDPTRISVGGQVNQTHEELAPNDDCDTSNDGGREVMEFGIFSIEDADFNSVNPNRKTEANWNFNVAPAQRGAAPFIAGPSSGRSGIPQDAGTGIGGTHWLSDSIWTKFGPRTVRYDLDSSSVDIAGAYWLSFYAQVGTATTGRNFVAPGSGSGEYGSWACGDHTSGIHEGWNCDVDAWYRNLDGSVPYNIYDLAKPGWLYQFRDVDCYDGAIEDLGVGTQPAYYGEAACPARPTS